MNCDTAVKPPTITASGVALGHDLICHLPIGDIRETPENWSIYHKLDASDQTWLDLCASVEEHGIREAITISLDNYIISGHRSYLAAKQCGLSAIPTKPSLVRDCRSDSVSTTTHCLHSSAGKPTSESWVSNRRAVCPMRRCHTPS